MVQQEAPSYSECQRGVPSSDLLTSISLTVTNYFRIPGLVHIEFSFIGFYLGEISYEFINDHSIS